ncbi:MAG: NADH:flavin oxidoreductase [Thermoleophilia bacterium]
MTTSAIAADPLDLPLAIGPLRLHGRAVLAPMTRTSATADGRATAQMRDYYARFAHGGFALVVTEGTYVDEDASQGYLHQPGIATAAQEEAWRPVVEAVHAAGAAIALQLMHAGALSQGNAHTTRTVGPSPLRPVGSQMTIYRGSGPYRVPAQLEPPEIERIAHAFAEAAGRARAAGFDAVEVHGANGYLLDQFTSTSTNRRTDRYGGGAANRIRLTVEVVHAIRTAVGATFPVGVRVSQAKVNDHDHRWPDGETAARTVFAALATAGASYLHTSEPDALRPAFGDGPTLARLAREHGRVPVIANGALRDPERARDLIDRGDADLVALGKPALANPDWPHRSRRALPHDDFDPAMLQPLATLDNAERWLASRTQAPGARS